MPGMSIPTPAHQPAGTPSGGQFAASARAEDPAVQLDGVPTGGEDQPPTDPVALIGYLDAERARESAEIAALREAADESEHKYDYAYLESAEAAFADNESRRFRQLADAVTDAARTPPQQASPHQPVTTGMLRDDWYQDVLGEDQVTALEALPERDVQQALDTAFRSYEDEWYAVLDNVRSDATAALLGEMRAGQ